MPSQCFCLKKKLQVPICKGAFKWRFSWAQGTLTVLSLSLAHLTLFLFPLHSHCFCFELTGQTRAGYQEWYLVNYLRVKSKVLYSNLVQISHVARACKESIYLSIYTLNLIINGNYFQNKKALILLVCSNLALVFLFLWHHDWDSLSIFFWLHRAGSWQTHGDPPASASQVMELKLCASMPVPNLTLNYFILTKIF